MDITDFDKLTDRQKEFLLSKMTDPETGTRHFEISTEVEKQVWFELLRDDGWVERQDSLLLGGNTSYYEISKNVWQVLVEAKAT